MKGSFWIVKWTFFFSWLLTMICELMKAWLLCVQQGYTLVLTGHSLGGAVAALLAMLIHASAHVPALGIFPTTLGVRPKKIMCWGYGCAPCVDISIAQNTSYIHNVVLQVSPSSLLWIRWWCNKQLLIMRHNLVRAGIKYETYSCCVYCASSSWLWDITLLNVTCK